MGQAGRASGLQRQHCLAGQPWASGPTSLSPNLHPSPVQWKASASSWGRREGSRRAWGTQNEPESHVKATQPHAWSRPASGPSSAPQAPPGGSRSGFCPCARRPPGNSMEVMEAHGMQEGASGNPEGRRLRVSRSRAQRDGALPPLPSPSPPPWCWDRSPRGRPDSHDHQPLALFRQAQEGEEADQQLQQQEEDVGQPPGEGGGAAEEANPASQPQAPGHCPAHP